MGKGSRQIKHSWRILAQRWSSEEEKGKELMAGVSKGGVGGKEGLERGIGTSGGMSAALDVFPSEKEKL